MIHVDEAGLYRLKGKEETDHNSIIVQLELPTATRTTQEKITNYRHKDGWETFNRIIEHKLSNKTPENYDEYENTIKNALLKSFKTISVTKGKYKYKKTEAAKELKMIKKKTRKEFEKAPPDQKYDKLQKYISAQKELRDELEACETARVEQRMNMIIKEGGVGSDHFWKIRKKYYHREKMKAMTLSLKMISLSQNLKNARNTLQTSIKTYTKQEKEQLNMRDGLMK